MTRPHLVLEELLRLLPDLEELEGLRLSLIGASAPDPGRAWERSSAFATIDKRVVEGDRVEEVLGDAERELHRYVEKLFARLAPLVHACRAGEECDAAAPLIELGEWLEGEGALAKARECFTRALALSLPMADKGVQLLALRRIARVALATGDFPEALRHYQRSAELARDSGELRGEVIARTGEGNVHALQGRWPDAETVYREALERLETAADPGPLTLERAQLLNNLGMTAVRQGRLEHAEERLALARALWARHPSPRDLAVCLHSYALLREEQGRREEARAALFEALRQEVPAATLAPIAIDLAESYLRDGLTREAGEWGRIAEQHAVVGRSPYYLARVYRGLGVLARERGEEDGFTFFEKALQISRERGYRLLEGETLVEYARLRERVGGHDEACGYLERAATLFRDLGAVEDQIRAEALLADLGALAPPPPPAG